MYAELATALGPGGLLLDGDHFTLDEKESPTLARLDLSPAQVLRELDELAQSMSESHIATCVYAVYDPVSGECVMASAGHLPPLLINPDGSVELVHLPPGAPLMISVPNIANLYVRLNLLFGRFPYANRGLLDRTHRVFFTRSLLRRLLADAGFLIARETVSTIPLPLAFPLLPPRLLATAGRLLEGLTRLLPTLLGYQILVLARRV